MKTHNSSPESIPLGSGRLQIVQFNDVYGQVPFGGQHEGRIEDADADLSTIVGNEKHFPDSARYPIPTGVNFGDYLTALVNQLRATQFEKAEKFGLDIHQDPATISNPLASTLVESLQRGLVVVTNSAVRDENGAAEFYVGVTKNKVVTISQLPFLRTLHAQRQLKELHRLPNFFFPKGFQFRSGDVTDTLIDGSKLERKDPATARIPEIELPGSLGWVDHFGNARILIQDISKIQELLVVGNEVQLLIDGTYELVAEVAASLDTAKLDILSVYLNATDPKRSHGPAYIEFARRVGKELLTTADFAYSALHGAVARNGRKINPQDWDNIPIEVVDARS